MTLYYPAPLVLSETAFLSDDDYQSKIDNRFDEPTIHVESTMSPLTVDSPSQQQTSALGSSYRSALDSGARQAPAAGSAVSMASTSRSRQAGKRQPGKKPRGGGSGGGGGVAGGGGEEQVFHYVVERFDDDVVDDSVPSPGVADPQSKDDRKSPGKKKNQQEGQAADKPTDDVAVRSLLTDDQLRRIAAERLWNVKRSPDARYTFDRLNR